MKSFPGFPQPPEVQCGLRARFLSVGLAPWVLALSVPRPRSDSFIFHSYQLDSALEEIKDPRVRRWATAFTNRYFYIWMTFRDTQYGLTDSNFEWHLRSAAEQFFRPFESRIISRYGDLLPDVALGPWHERLVNFAVQPGIHLTMNTIVRRARSYRQLL